MLATHGPVEPNCPRLLTVDPDFWDVRVSTPQRDGIPPVSRSAYFLIYGGYKIADERTSVCNWIVYADWGRLKAFERALGLGDREPVWLYHQYEYREKGFWRFVLFMSQYGWGLLAVALQVAALLAKYCPPGPEESP